MRKTLATVCLPLLSFTSLCAQASVEQSFNVADFTRVAASQGIEVNVIMGNTAQVVASAATEKDLGRLEIEVDDGELRIRRGSWSSSIWNWGES